MDGTVTILYSFANKPDGAYPTGAIAKDDQGNLYGTTLKGGEHGAGIIFQVSSGGVETILHSFRRAINETTPNGVRTDQAGNLYGTTVNGGKYDKSREIAGLSGN